LKNRYGRSAHVKPLPLISHVVLVSFIAVAEPYCANVLVPVVPAVLKNIVSDVIAILMAVADIFINISVVPIGYATDALAGIVYVAAPAPSA
jgi:hypothetical protein